MRKIRRTRTAEEIAQVLTAAGFEVISFKEAVDNGNRYGVVYLAKPVHVKVGKDGQSLTAVHESAAGKVTSWPARSSIAKLIEYVGCAKNLDKAWRGCLP